MALKYSEIKAFKKECRSIGELKRRCLEETLLKKSPVEQESEKSEKKEVN